MHLNGWLGGLLAAGAMVLAGAAAASAPPQNTQAPGYYRMRLGDVEITALNDGTFGLNAAEVLTGITPAKLDEALERSFLREPVEESVNGFLVNTGTKLVLIDTGAGSFFGPTLGRLLGNLRASGYRPDQVDEIYLTHLHGDHVGGLIRDGKAVFANAVVRCARREADYWLSKDNPEKAAKEALAPYIAAGRFKPFDGDAELVPGIRAVAAPGHTPGHTLYEVESRGETLLLWGDLMHVGAAQFPDPSVTAHYDVDSPAAAEQRKKFFAEAAEHRFWVGGAHLSFPGIGHLRAAGTGYTFVHANYSSLQKIGD